MREKLLTIKQACNTFDRKTAKDTISQLRQEAWPAETKEQLAVMAEQLLSGDFDEVSIYSAT